MTSNKDVPKVELIEKLQEIFFEIRKLQKAPDYKNDKTLSNVMLFILDAINELVESDLDKIEKRLN